MEIKTHTISRPMKIPTDGIVGIIFRTKMLMDIFIYQMEFILLEKLG